MKVKNTKDLLSRVRKLMTSGEYSSNPLQSVIVPSSDAHNSEYLAPCDCRRAFISGFTGSSGTVVITLDEAVIWTDGRYFLQAEKELDENWILMKQGMENTPKIEDWLNKVLPPSSFVGVNSKLFTIREWNQMSVALSQQGNTLINIYPDIIDAVWDNQPLRPSNPLIIVNKSVAGLSVKEKISVLWTKMTIKKADFIVLSSLDDIAWLLNLRGSDIKYNPVFFSYIVLSKNILHIFINCKLIVDKVRCHLENCSVEYHEYNVINDYLKTQCIDLNVWMSENTSHAIRTTIKPSNLILTTYSPVASLKAVKNKCEIEGMKKANLYDSVALCRYFEWLENEVPKRNVTECSASAKALEYRKENSEFISLSFNTISSTGANGSIIHYSPSIENDFAVSESEIYLCDSGGQYTCGTTDTTRTMHFGTPTKYEKECFTRVLKGHISLCSIVFPKGTKGYMLDILARMYLWKEGLDYNHGTGHGVGSFLNVHEGPVGIYIGNNEKIITNARDCEIVPGMIITDEPGYYENSKFGIRIENALLCVPAKTKYNFNEKPFYTFEPLCYLPIQQKMIEVSMLTNEEIHWINKYHKTCNLLLGEELNKNQSFKSTLLWLQEQTKPLENE